MPTNSSTEHRLVSCLLKDPEAVWVAVAAGVESGHFSDTLCRKTWDLLSQGFEYTAGDTLSIAEALTPGRPFSEAEEIDDALQRIDAIVEVSVSAKAFAQRLVDERVDNDIQRAIRVALEDIGSGTSARIAVKALQSRLSELEAMGGDTLPPSASEIAERVSRRILEPDTKNPDDTLIYFGLDHNDRALTPIRPHELVVVAAQASGGKSSLAAHIARVNAVRGVPMVYFTLETDADSVIEQMAAQQSLYPPIAEYEPGIPSSEKYMAGVTKVGGMPIYVDDRHSLLHEIEQITHTLHRAKGIQLVVVDYLQLVELTKRDRPESREQYISSISRRLKKITSTLRIPVIALSQINREAEKQARRPKMSDLRESGSIEQDADRVLILHRPEKDFRGDDQSLANGIPRTAFDTELIQRKCRRGPRDVFCRLVFQATTTSFSPYQPNPAFAPINRKEA